VSKSHTSTTVYLKQVPEVLQALCLLRAGSEHKASCDNSWRAIRERRLAAVANKCRQNKLTGYRLQTGPVGQKAID